MPVALLVCSTVHNQAATRGRGQGGRGQVLNLTFRRRHKHLHDSAGRIVEQTDPLGRLTTFAYDAAGRQMFILDARGILPRTKGDGPSGESPVGTIPLMRSFKRPFWHFGQSMGRKVEV